MPASGSPTKPSRGAAAVMRPTRGRAVRRVVVADQPEPVLEALGEALVEHRARRGRRAVGSPIGAAAQPLVEPADELVVDLGRGRSRCRATCSAAPPCRSRRTARPRRRGRGRRRPSRPSGSCRRAPGTATAGGGRTARRSPRRRREEPVKPTLSTSRALERPLEPRERLRAVRVDEVEHAGGHAARVEQPRQRGARRRRVLRGLPHDRVAAQDRRARGTRRARRRGSCPR